MQMHSGPLAMVGENIKRAEEIFQVAVEAPAGQRPAILDRDCDGDTVLRAFVEQLLSNDEAGMGEFLRKPVFTPAFEDTAGGDADLPTRLGAYEIIGAIGEGGMGVVYEARQENPRRTVALKVIRPGPAASKTLRRFQHEVEVLGQLQHPGIAQIHEAGVADLQTATGATMRQPFFAMELIRGEPLNTYATNAGLDPRQRLELVANVCDAVQHAHQRGVIHRDLKPANILVEGSGQPKILDFGVARATGADVQTITTQAGVGQIIGTVPYMSPEQVTGDSRQLDTRSDVYALGVILYELLSGCLPHEVNDLSVPEAVRKIRDEEPRRIGSIDRALRGEIETIVARALEKDKTRRYQSASDLADDIRRYLDGAPIEAKRDSALYVLRKTVARYRGWVAAGGLLFALVVVFGLVSFGQAQKNRRLAVREGEARARADATAGRIAAELTASNIERGRLFGVTGNLHAAEDLIWPEYLRDPASEHARWALRELYTRHPLRMSLIGHDSSIRAVALSSDESILASASHDGSIKLWDTGTGRCLATLVGHRDRVTGVVFARDRRGDEDLLASCSFDGTVRLWDVWRGQLADEDTGLTPGPHVVLDESQKRLLCITSSRGGSLLAWGGFDGLLRVYDTSKRRLWTSDMETGGLTSVAISPDASRLVTGLRDGTIGLWSLAGGPDETPVAAHVANLKGHTATVRALAFRSGDGLLASGGYDRSIRLWNLTDRECVRVIETANGPVPAVAFTPDGRQVASCGLRSIDFWDVETGQRVRAVMSRRVFGLSLSQDGQTLYGGDGESVVRVWQTLPDRSKTWIAEHEGRSYGLSISPDGLTAATGGRKATVQVWDVVSRRLRRTLTAHADQVYAVKIAPDNKWLATASRDGFIKIWDLATLTCQATMRGFNHDGKALAFSPDSDQPITLVSGRADGVAVRWQVPSGVMIDSWKAADGDVVSVSFSPDGSMIATATDRVIRLWNADSLEAIADFPSRDGSAFWYLAISPDSRLLAGGTWGNVVEVWDISTKQRVAVLEGHTGLISCLAFDPDPDGRLLASCSDGGAIKLWDTGTFRCLATLDPGAERVHTVAFVPAGPAAGSLWSTHSNGTAAVWDLSYYDRHIAGNVEYQVRRLGPTLFADEMKIERLRQWASRVSRGGGAP